jgi:spore maturation protein CgeB
MNVLLVAALSDEGVPENGPSYEHYHLRLPLARVADRVTAFDFMAELSQYGRRVMNERLVDAAIQSRPDVVIVAPFTDQLDFPAIDRIRTIAPTIGYFFDDVWRLDFTSAWAHHVTWITTSDVNGVERYKARGIKNVVYSPFGCNLDLFRPLELATEHDISFVGRYHPYRAWIFRRLETIGKKVVVRGTGWPVGRASTGDMVSLFNTSRINLNLSNCVSWDVRYLGAVRRPVTETLRAWRGALRAARESDVKTREMVKGRHFEISACGGFQLSFYVEGLEHHYEIGREIAVYTSTEDLIEKVQYFLAHDSERRAIAAAGLARTRRDHGMENRLRDLLAVASAR